MEKEVKIKLSNDEFELLKKVFSSDAKIVKEWQTELNRIIRQALENPNNWTKIGDLEWSEDLGAMNWNKACERCERLSGRLPTRVELLDLYDNHQGEVEDWDNYCWSSTECSSDDRAYYVYFSDGNIFHCKKVNSYYVRCVRECN